MTEPSARLTHVPVAALPVGRFEDVLSAAQTDDLRRNVARARDVLAGRVVWNINSTAQGGGVAEMLTSLIAYTRGAGVDARWVVIFRGVGHLFVMAALVHGLIRAFRRL